MRLLEEVLSDAMSCEPLLVAAKRKLKDLRIQGLREEVNYLRLRIQQLEMAIKSLKIITKLLENCRQIQVQKSEEIISYCRQISKAANSLRVLVE